MTKRSREARPRIFLGVVEIAGYYRALRDGFRELGVPATFVDTAGHPFEYDGAEQGPWPTSLVRRINTRVNGMGPGPARRSSYLAGYLLRALLLLRVALTHDVFIYGFGLSLLPLPALEFGLLRLLRRRIIFVFHGSDTRPPYLDGALMSRQAGRTIDDCIALTGASKARVRVLDRFATHVVNSPAASHFHERRCVNWHCIGLPVREASGVETLDDAKPRPIRILHSPSNPEVKGTDVITAAVEALRARGHDIELVLITGKPNREVLRELARCDFVVDQVYSDVPMAGFAAEAASFGKPAIVCGYAEALFRQYVPAELLPPTYYCRPEQIEAAIERLVTDREFRIDLGRRAQQFVRTHWTARAIAERYLRLLDPDGPPSEWTFDPGATTYCHGGGLPESRARELIRGVIDRGGVEALAVGDKEALTRRLVDFARGDGGDLRHHPARVAAAPDPAGHR